MMGAGKSSIGRALADVSGREFADTDILVQQRVCRSIKQIFEIYGESAFRDHEHALLRTLERKDIVLATGGGVVLRPDNWLEMKRLGTIIYLRSSPEAIIGKLTESKKKRPLLEGEGWQEKVIALCAERRPLYEQADIHIDVDGRTIQENASTIFGLLENRV